MYKSSVGEELGVLVSEAEITCSVERAGRSQHVEDLPAMVWERQALRL